MQMTVLFRRERELGNRKGHQSSLSGVMLSLHLFDCVQCFVPGRSGKLCSQPRKLNTVQCVGLLHCQLA